MLQPFCTACAAQVLFVHRSTCAFPFARSAAKLLASDPCGFLRGLEAGALAATFPDVGAAIRDGATFLRDEARFLARVRSRRSSSIWRASGTPAPRRRP